MNIDDGALNIYPTELAKRRAERSVVLAEGVVDASRIFTQKKLMVLCERSARRGGFLTQRTLRATEQRLLLEEAAERIDWVLPQPLARISTSAQARILSQLIDQFSFLAEHESALTQWFLSHDSRKKLHGYGLLLQSWRTVCTEQQLADRFQVNRSLLNWIAEGELPKSLCHGIIFRAVRWFNPFEERLVAALKARLGNSAVRIWSVLPEAHAATAGERLGSCMRSELERGAEEEWTPWAEDLADAMEIDDSNILADNADERVAFFESANPYGEIEDVARRVARDIENGLPPDEIAIILRDLSPYTDIVPDVFQRFNLPYNFRRGSPAAANPRVKSLLALLTLQTSRSRDRLCDLLLSPFITWPGIEERDELVRSLLKTEPARLKRFPQEVQTLLPDTTAPVTPCEFAASITERIALHELVIPEAVTDLIQNISELDQKPLKPAAFLSLFEELLDNVTLTDPKSTESGVWIINPMDAAGLRFDSIYLGGMDDRSFPRLPQANPLLNLNERTQLLAFFQQQRIPCPKIVLSEVGEAFIQEEILFLTAISCAKENLTLSYTRMDGDGKDRPAGPFYERLRALTGLDAKLGDSFQTILPFSACRAEDETRQTDAWKSPATAPELGALGAADCKEIIEQWIATHSEFSATALESLARNRYVYFLEHVLRIRPEQTHEDDTSPLDRGSLIHAILEKVYCAIAERSDYYATPTHPDALGFERGWKLTQARTADSIQVAVFTPSHADDLLKLAREITEAEFFKAETHPNSHLGHPTVWETEKGKLHRIIENYIRLDLETAVAEHRYPALFEMQFDAKSTPLTLERNGETLKLKGKIDRVDLVFDEENELSELRVIDYKSSSRNEAPEMLEIKMSLNLDCQLGLYTFAAQQRIFGQHNTPELNEKTQAVYHLQSREKKTMTNHFAKKRLSLQPEVSDAFIDQLFLNMKLFKAGDLATDPLIAGYEDFSHICRTTALDPKAVIAAAKAN